MCTVDATSHVYLHYIAMFPALLTACVTVRCKLTHRRKLCASKILRHCGRTCSTTGIGKNRSQAYTNKCGLQPRFLRCAPSPAINGEAQACFCSALILLLTVYGAPGYLAVIIDDSATLACMDTWHCYT